ncbi:hypothetical protein C0J52_10300 [Blattella germanica]|nr:hypothetical protein C0J52_10300 [Blattella germanica]
MIIIIIIIIIICYISVSSGIYHIISTINEYLPGMPDLQICNSVRNAFYSATMKI